MLQEFIDNAVPGNALGNVAGGVTDLAEQIRPLLQGGRSAQESGFVSERSEHGAVVVFCMFVSGGVVKADQCQTAGVLLVRQIN